MLVAEKPTKVEWKTSDITTRTVLAVFELPFKDRGHADDYIVRLRGCPRKVAWSAMERENKRGYIEYGVSLCGGWLTESGKSKLDELCAE